MDILAILARESENVHQVYLYEEGGHWYAYEQSARLMEKVMGSGIKVRQVVYDLYSIIIDILEVEWASFVFYPIVLCSDNEIVIDFDEKTLV